MSAELRSNFHGGENILGQGRNVNRHGAILGMQMHRNWASMAQ
jgi:hypothetical protein